MRDEYLIEEWHFRMLTSFYNNHDTIHIDRNIEMNPDVEGNDEDVILLENKRVEKMISDKLDYLSYREHRSYENTPWFNLSLDNYTSLNLRFYFTFGYILLTYSFAMSCLAILYYILHLYYLTQQIDQTLWDLIFYTENPFIWLTMIYMNSVTSDVWYLLIIINIILSFFVAPFYMYCVHYHHSKTKMESRHFDEQVIDQPTQGIVGFDGGIDSILQITNSLFSMIKIYVYSFCTGSNFSSEYNMQTLIHRNLQINPKYLSYIINNNDNNGAEKIQYHFIPDVEKSTGFTDKDIKEIYILYPSEDEQDIHHVIDDIPIQNVLEYHKSTHVQKIRGRIESVMIYMILLGIHAVINWLVYTKVEFENAFFYSLVLATISLIANVIGESLSNMSTNLEQHSNKSTYFTSYFLKIWLYKLVSTILVFGFSFLSIGNNGNINGNDPIVNPDNQGLDETTCTISTIGSQFFTSTLAFLVSPILNIVAAMIQNKISQLRFIKNLPQSDNAFKSEFSIILNWSDLWNLFLLLSTGFCVIPAVSVFIFVILLIKLKLTDPYQIFQLSAPIPTTRNSFTKILLFANTCTSILSLLWMGFIIASFVNNCHFLFTI